MAAQIAAVSRLVEEIGENALEPNDIQIVTWNSTVSGTILRRDADATAYGELKDWVDALSSSVSGGTDFGVAVSQAGAFFNGSGGKRRILIFVTDGEPSPASTRSDRHRNALRHLRGRCLRLQHRAVGHQRHRPDRQHARRWRAGRAARRS